MYKQSHPAVTSSGFIGRKFGRIEVVDVRARTPQSGGSGRIAILKSGNERRIVLYGRVTYAERLRQTEGANAARAYMRSAFDEGVSTRATAPSTIPKVKAAAKSIAPHTKPNAVARGPKVKEGVAEPSPDITIASSAAGLRATADVLEFIERLNTDPVTRAAWNEAAPRLLD